MAQFSFRALLLKIQDLLSDSDRQRLHFLLGEDVPRYLRDDKSVEGALRVLESLIDKTIINEQDCQYLIEAFKAIQCDNAARRLQEYQQAQKTGTEGTVSLQHILLETNEPDRIAAFGVGSVTLESTLNRLDNDRKPVIFSPTSAEPSSLEHVKTKTHFNLSWFFSGILKRSFTIRICILLLIIILTLLVLLFTIFFWKKSEILPKKRNDGICPSARWNQFGVTVAGTKSRGAKLNQLNTPNGIFVDETGTVYVADTENNRIMKWVSGTFVGQLVAGELKSGNASNQLNIPTDVIVDVNGMMYVGDYENQRILQWPLGAANGQPIIQNLSSNGLAVDDEGSLYISDILWGRVIKWRKGDTDGQILASGLHRPSWLCVDNNRSVYVPDRDSHQVLKIVEGMPQGFKVAGGSQGVNLDQLDHPQGVTVDRLGNLYVADTGNHRIMRWLAGAKSGSLVIGGRGRGSQRNQLDTPTDLQFDQDGNLYVADALNHRVQKFNFDKTSCS